MKIIIGCVLALSSIAYADDAVTVVKAGAEPRKPLRLVAKAGEHHAIDMTVANTRAPRDLKGKLLPAETQPGMHTVMDYTVKSVDAAGTATIDFVYRAFEITPGKGLTVGAPPSANMAAGLVGTHGHFTLTTTGEIANAGFDVPEKTSPELRAVLDASRDSLPQLADRLPDVALGKGAVWETKRTMHAGELAITVVTTHELTALTGSRITLKLTQKIDGKSASPKDGTITIAGKGAGTETLDLDGALPAGLTLTVDQDIDLKNGDMHLAQRASMMMVLVRK